MTAPDVPASLAALRTACDAMTSAYQPIVDLTTGRTVAYEALARFPDGLAPGAIFDVARRLGCGVEVEAAAIDSALGAGLPPGLARLSVNLSPSALVAEAAVGRLPADLSRFTVEITENELVAHSEVVADRLAMLRARGALIAVDDAGAGYASLRQVMLLRPDVIKLDRSLIEGVHADAAKRSLIRAFVMFGRHIGAGVCAEGIEHVDELRVLADLDVATGQGYVLGRPAAAWSAIREEGTAACAASLRDALRGGDRSTVAEAESEATLESVGRGLAACGTYAELDRCLLDVERLLEVPDVSISQVVDHHGAPGIEACAGRRWVAEPVYPLSDFPATVHALETGEALQVLCSDPEADPVERRLLVEHGYGALLLVPLLFRGTPVGLLEAYSPVERPWTRHQIVLARTVGHQVALVLAHLAAESSAARLRAA